MTYLEKVLSENTQMKPCEVMEEKCPSDFGYEDSKGADCNFSLELDCCIKCWNREMPEVVDVSMLVEKYHEGLNDGRNEAWELAQKINCYVDEGGISQAELVEIFDSGDTCKIMCLSYEEAFAKLKAYEDSKIEVGDVVVAFNETLIVVTSLEGNMIYGIDAQGLVSARLLFGDVKKTGKHIDIKSILEQIGE